MNLCPKTNLNSPLTSTFSDPLNFTNSGNAYLIPYCIHKVLSTTHPGPLPFQKRLESEKPKTARLARILVARMGM